jgi:hypothetical protein
VQVSNSAGADDWQTVLPSQPSSGKSAGLETHAFAPTAVRRLRIVGHGNTNAQAAHWINILEVSFIPASTQP